jgi:hypothetical protein
MDATYVANEISLLRDICRGAVLLVEGADDALLFEKFLSPGDTCRIRIANGKPNALEVLTLLRDRSFGDGVAVLVDADFWHLTNEEPEDADILLTEFHDLEMDMLASDAFGDLVREVVDSASLQRSADPTEPQLRATAITESAKVGALRYLNYEKDWYLDFKSVDITDHVEFNQRMVLSINGYVAELLTSSADGSLEAAVILTLIEDVLRGSPDLYQIVQGHDCIGVLSATLQAGLLKPAWHLSTAETVESCLRLAYTRDHFGRGQLCADIEKWEDRTGYVILS